MVHFHPFRFSLLVIVFVASCSSLRVLPKEHRHVYRTPYAVSAMDSVALKVNAVQRKLKEALEIIGDNNSKITLTKKILHSIIDYAREAKRVFELKCPVDGAAIDIERGNCLLYRDIRYYGRNWKDARQYCLQRGGDLAQPSIYDATYVDALINFFPILTELRTDVSIGIRAVMGMTDYHYEYLNGLTIDSDNVHFRNSSNGNPDWGFVAALSIPIIPDHGLEINDRDSTEIRGFICEFQLKPFVPKYKPIPNHIDDSVDIDPEDMVDVEAPLEEPVSSEESEESTEHEHYPPVVYSDFEDEIPCEGRCSDVQVCNYVADRCEPPSSCDHFCSVGEICSSGQCITPCYPVCSDGSVCNIATSQCETVDSCGNVCNSNQICDDISRTCLYTCCDCEEGLECNPISGRCEVFSLFIRGSLLNITEDHRTSMNDGREPRLRPVSGSRVGRGIVNGDNGDNGDNGGEVVDEVNGRSSSDPNCDNSCLNHQRCNSDNECEDVCVDGCPLDQLCNIIQETCLPIDKCCQNCAADEPCTESIVQDCNIYYDYCGRPREYCDLIKTHSCSSNIT